MFYALPIQAFQQSDDRFLRHTRLLLTGQIDNSTEGQDQIVPCHVPRVRPCITRWFVKPEPEYIDE